MSFYVLSDTTLSSAFKHLPKACSGQRRECRRRPSSIGAAHMQGSIARDARCSSDHCLRSKNHCIVHTPIACGVSSSDAPIQSRSRICTVAASCLSILSFSAFLQKTISGEPCRLPLCGLILQARLWSHRMYNMQKATSQYNMSQDSPM